MPNENLVPVMIRLPQTVYDKIPAEKGHGGRAVRGGISAWITDLVHEKLGIEKAQKLRDPDLSKLDLSKLDPKTRHIVTLYNNGMSVKQLTEELRRKGIPTVRGGVWREDNLRMTLIRLAERHKV